MLLITRDTSDSHAGRLRLKYGPSNTFSNGTRSYSNQAFFDLAKHQLGLADDACWFAADISIRNQNELILKTIVVDANGSVEYADSASLHKAWNDLEATKFPTGEVELKEGDNIILYGVPGCGKSHTMVLFRYDLRGITPK